MESVRLKKTNTAGFFHTSTLDLSIHKHTRACMCAHTHRHTQIHANTVRDKKVDQTEDNIGRGRVLKEVGSEEGKGKRQNIGFSQMQTRFTRKHIFIFFTWVTYTHETRQVNTAS